MYLAQAKWSAMCGVSCVVKAVWCNGCKLCSAIRAVQDTRCKLYVSNYVVQHKLGGDSDDDDDVHDD
eukprot:7816271-Pyramimonas_sp.AAC.1